MKIKHRKSFGHYIMDSVLGVQDVERNQKERELKILKNSMPPSSIPCSSCGKIGVVAQCSNFLCKKKLCKNCAKKRDGKYFCYKHI